MYVMEIEEGRKILFLICVCVCVNLDTLLLRSGEEGRKGLCLHLSGGKRNIPHITGK